MAGRQINARRRSLIPPTIRVVTRQSDASPRAGERVRADPSGPPACAERAGAECQTRLGVGCFLRDHMGCAHTEMQTARGVGLCVGMTCRHWTCLGSSLRRVGP